jgi:hypothetical protein
LFHFRNKIEVVNSVFKKRDMLRTIRGVVSHEHQSSVFTISSAVHDLNNKIGIILTRCDLLETDCQLGTRATANLKAIRKAAEALAAMVSQLGEANREQ